MFIYIMIMMMIMIMIIMIKQQQELSPLPGRHAARGRAGGDGRLPPQPSLPADAAGRSLQ